MKLLGHVQFSKESRYPELLSLRSAIQVPCGWPWPRLMTWFWSSLPPCVSFSISNTSMQAESGWRKPSLRRAQTCNRYVTHSRSTHRPQTCSSKPSSRLSPLRVSNTANREGRGLIRKWRGILNRPLSLRPLVWLGRVRAPQQKLLRKPPILLNML